MSNVHVHRRPLQRERASLRSAIGRDGPGLDAPALWDADWCLASKSCVVRAPGGDGLDGCAKQNRGRAGVEACVGLAGQWRL